MKLDNIDFLSEFPQIEPSASRKFHISTNIDNIQDFVKTPYSKWPKSWKETHYKTYIRFPSFELTVPKYKRWDLQNILMKRESSRKFISKPVSEKDLSTLLYYSAGQRSLTSKTNTTKRMYPSAGARYPIEIYPFILKPTGAIRRGIYHYHPPSHSIELIKKNNFLNQTWKQFSQPWMKTGAVLLIFTAIFDRVEEKYGNRGYRHVMTDYGLISQNLYLVSTAIGVGACSIGGFDDNGINEILDLDGIDESIVGAMILGNINE